MAEGRLTGRWLDGVILRTEFLLAALLALRSSDASVPLAAGSDLEPRFVGSSSVGSKHGRGPCVSDSAAIV